MPDSIMALLLCHALLGASPAPAPVPAISAPLVPDGAITVDGRLTEGAWRRAEQPAPFLLLGSMGLSPVQPQVLVCRDSANLYVAARLPKPAGSAVKAAVTKHDGQVWEDDAVEVFLDPNRSGSRYYQFIANAAGAHWDSAGKDPAWNATWHSAARARREDSFWTLEMQIPFAALGGPPATGVPSGRGAVWGLNVAWDRQTPSPLTCSWAALPGDLHEPARFCELLFPASAPGIAVSEASAAPVAGRLTWKASVLSAHGAATTMSFAFGKTGAMETPQRSDVPAGAEAPWRAEERLAMKGGLVADVGDHVGVATALVGGAPVYRAVIPMKVPPPVKLTVKTYLLRTDKIEVQADAGVLAAKTPVKTLEVALVDATGKDVAKMQEGFKMPGVTADAWLNVHGVKPGDYSLVTRVLAADGKAGERKSMPVTIPPKPAWLGNKLGISDKVMPPWTPLRVAGSSISPWGRTYTWKALPFPAQVRTKDADILAGPMRLVAIVDGSPQVWAGQGPHFTKKTPARVEFTTQAESQSTRVEGSLWCEYDGCVRCDWRLAERHPGSKLQSLIFEIPVKPQYAKYLYSYPGRWGSAYNAHALTKDVRTLFRPYVWLGDNWRGLAWFCPSNQPFRPANPEDVTEVVREKGQVVLRINLVQKPISLDKPFKCTFGFEATPIRHNDKTVWDYRIIHTGQYGLDKQPWTAPASIQWPAEGNLNLSQGTFEAWVRPRFDPHVSVPAGDGNKGRFNRDLLTIDYGSNEVQFYWNIDDRGMRLILRTPGGKYPVVLGARDDWKEGEWHHIAFSWGKKLRIFSDGKQVAEEDWTGLLPGSLSGGTIWLGHGLSEFDVDDMCISDVARAPRGQAGPLKPDAHTLLLESFDKLGTGGPDARPTVPERAAGGPGSAVGTVNQIAGKFGGAVALGSPSTKYLKLDYYKKMGVKTIVFHEQWSNIQSYFDPAEPAALHSLVKACHAHGIKLLVYYGYELSDIAPEWKTYRDEVLVNPVVQSYHRQPEQKDYMVCYKSAWQDYLAWAVAQTMDKYDMDGVYLDGTANPGACENLAHGCGYIGRDGKLHPTYDFFAAREMMKRIYTIVKTRDPEGEVNLHQSTCMCIPSIGWATSYWDGEQFGSIPRSPENWPLKILPLDTFRTEFMGHQWGVPSELLCYDQPYTFEQAMAIALPHDVLVRPHDSELALASKVWMAALKFGREQARWLPYWQNPGAATNSRDLLCSLYTRGAKGALLVVSNLGHYSHRANVKLDLKVLDLPAELTARDVVTDADIPVKSGEMRFDMAPLTFKMIWVKPAS